MKFRGRKNRQIKENKPMILNITSMTDMFTILLVFLLQNYSSEQLNIELNRKTNLPTSNSELNPSPALQIEFGKGFIKFDNKPELSFNSNFEVIDQKIKEMMITENNNQSRRVLLKIDKDIEYKEIEQLMNTVARNGFTDIQLLTQVGE